MLHAMMSESQSFPLNKRAFSRWIKQQRDFLRWFSPKDDHIDAIFDVVIAADHQMRTAGAVPELVAALKALESLDV